MNKEILISRVGEVQSKLDNTMFNMIMDKREVEDVLDKIYDVREFYEKNDINCQYDLDKMYDETIKGFIVNQLELVEVINEIDSLVDSADYLYCDLVECEEYEEADEVLEIKEILEECQNQINYEDSSFCEIAEYIDNLETAQDLLLKI